jgi:hypothetical protein
VNGEGATGSSFVRSSAPRRARWGPFYPFLAVGKGERHHADADGGTTPTVASINYGEKTPFSEPRPPYLPNYGADPLDEHAVVHGDID